MSYDTDLKKQKRVDDGDNESLAVRFDMQHAETTIGSFTFQGVQECFQWYRGCSLRLWLQA
jgi:hypothetical protein